MEVTAKDNSIKRKCGEYFALYCIAKEIPESESQAVPWNHCSMCSFHLICIINETKLAKTKIEKEFRNKWKTKKISGYMSVVSNSETNFTITKLSE